MNAQNAGKIPKGDIVLVLLSLAFEKGMETVKEESLYYAFKKITEQYPQYFDGWYFHNLSGGLPYCGDFEDTLFRLGSSGCLLRTGIRMSSFTMEKRTITAAIKSFKKHNGEQAFKEISALLENFTALID